MIKIIKSGNNEKLKGTKTFSCGTCGCTFKADKEDYYSGSSYCQCTCPYCNFEVIYNFSYDCEQEGNELYK